MGKGIALRFRERFPINYRLYQDACRKGEVQTGKMFITSTNSMINPKWLINFPTKRHWRQSSEYEYIETGLNDLVDQIQKLNIRSVAIPPLGSGQGGLDWEKVKKQIVTQLNNLDIEITVFEPSAQTDDANLAKKAHLTKARAMILALVHAYRKLGYDSTLLEVQKLAYFIQRMGQKDLNLHFKKYHYGPYAHNLQHLLHELGKGYLVTDRSVFDSKPLDVIRLNPETIDLVVQFIQQNSTNEEKERLKKVLELMSGFESPFGLELLASVDWILYDNPTTFNSPENIKNAISKWSSRKDRSFDLNHIEAAHKRLSSFHKELQYSS
jgi:O-acetyl-ADP-ribose deacetylase (regulator of RNase III)